MTILASYEIGTKVTVDKNVNGCITAVMIEQGYKLTYRVSYWSGNERKQEWLQDFEITPTSDPVPMKIGFKGTNHESRS